MTREEYLEKYLSSQGIPYAGAAALAVMLILRKIEEEEKENE